MSWSNTRAISYRTGLRRWRFGASLIMWLNLPECLEDQAVSRSSVAISMMRSKACRVFETLLTMLPSTDGVCARDVEWDKMA